MFVGGRYRMICCDDEGSATFQQQVHETIFGLLSSQCMYKKKAEDRQKMEFVSHWNNDFFSKKGAAKVPATAFTGQA